jgi:ATP-binding cassette subfamily B protein
LFTNRIKIVSSQLGTQPEASALKAIWKSMSGRRRGHFLSVVGVMLLGTLAELATIGAVLPFLALVSDPQRAAHIPGFRQIIEVMGAFAPTNLVLLAAILLVISAVLATIVRLVLTWVSLSFVLALSHEIGTAIFGRMLRQPYEYYVTRNTSELLSGVEKVSTVVWGVLMPGMQGVSAIVMSVAIMALLLVIDPFTATMVAATMAIAYFFVSLSVRPRLNRNSEQLAGAATSRIQVMQEGMGGIRDVLLEHSQAMFESKFRQIDYLYRRAQATNNFINLAPRFVVEGAGIVAIAVLAFYFSNQPGGVVAAIPVLGALAIGAQRLLPLLQQTYVAWSSYAGNREVLKDVVALMHAPIISTTRPVLGGCAEPFTRDLQLVDVGFQYGGREHTLQNINLTIPKGGCVGFVAETGGGKSTLFDVIMALIKPTSGAVLIDGKALSPANCAGWQAQIAHVPQAIFLADTTIAANIAFGAADEDIDLSRVKQAATQAHIDNFITQLPDGYDTLVGERGVRLSGGQRQRIGIARALYKKAQVLILDEATSALDDETEAAIMRSILSLGDEVTLLMIAHRLSTLRECDQIVRLEGGRIVGIGSFSEIVSARETAGNSS